MFILLLPYWKEIHVPIPDTPRPHGTESLDIVSVFDGTCFLKIFFAVNF